MKLSTDAQSFARAAFSWTLAGSREDLERALLTLTDDELTEVYLAAHDLATAVNAHQIDRFGFKPMAVPS
jgi:hypothetical protein